MSTFASKSQQENAHRRQSLRRRELAKHAKKMNTVSNRWEPAICERCHAEFRCIVRSSALKLCKPCKRVRRAEVLAADYLRRREQEEVEREALPPPLPKGIFPCRGCGSSTPYGKTCTRCGDTNQIAPVRGAGRMGHPR